MKLAAFFAYRFIKGARRQSLLLLAGLSLGVAVLVVAAWLVDGLRASLDQAVTGDLAHLTLSGTQAGPADMAYDEGLLEAIQAKETKVTAITPLMTVPAKVILLAHAPEKETSVLVLGIDQKTSAALYPLGDSILRGRTFLSGREVVVSWGFAQRYGLGEGDRLLLEDHQGSVAYFTIVGLYDFGKDHPHTPLLFADLRVLQSAFGREGIIDRIEIQLQDPYQADVLASELQTELNPEEITVMTWSDLNRQHFNAGLLHKRYIRILTSAVTLVILMGTVLILSVAVSQRTLQLGTLRALGLGDGQAVTVFGLYAVFLSAAGLAVGLLAAHGVILAYWNQSLVVMNAHSLTPSPDLLKLALTLVALPVTSGLSALGIGFVAVRKDPGEAVLYGSS